MTGWCYHHPTHVVFGPGSLSLLNQYVPYKRILLVTTNGFQRRGVVERVTAALKERVIHVVTDVHPNPTIREIDQQYNEVHSLRPDAIIALGGGSCIDTAKALARMHAQPTSEPLGAYLCDGIMFDQVRALPTVAIPTTAGSGAEVTPFATVWEGRSQTKHSLTGAGLYPVTAVVDPELTITLPREITVSSGFDAIAHALESTWNRNANPITLSLAAASLRRSWPALHALLSSPDDKGARTDMMQASVLAGMAISQTRTALSHSISYPLTARFRVPHGIACSISLPTLVMFNSAQDDGRMAFLIKILGYEDPIEFSEALTCLIVSSGARDTLRRLIPNSEALLQLANDMVTPGRTDNNIRPVSRLELESIVEDAAKRLLED